MIERGVNLAALRDIIPDLLDGYEQQSGGLIAFDTAAATLLERTPARPNFARSVANVAYKETAIGVMTLIVFAPGDGTGDEGTYSLDALQTGSFPRHPRVVPRSKASVHTEGHITLAAIDTTTITADPVPYAGSLDLLGLSHGNPCTVRKMGELGQRREQYQRSLTGLVIAEPTATLTTGYRLPAYETDDDEMERFGDPHTVFNQDQRFAQLCGFLAVVENPNDPGSVDLRVFEGLHAQQPILI